MLSSKTRSNFSKQLQEQMITIKFGYSDRLQDYLTNLITGLRSIFKTKYFEYISETTNCNPGFVHFIEDCRVDVSDWLQDGLAESSRQFLHDLRKIRKILKEQSRFDISCAEAIIEECDHYTQILSHFPQVVEWKDQIDQYKFEVSLLCCAYRLHQQMLVDIDVSINSKQRKAGTIKTLLADLNSLDHHEPKTLLTFIHLLSKQLMMIASDKNYQAQLQKAHNSIYTDLYKQLTVSLTGWREMLSNARHAMLTEEQLDSNERMVIAAQTEQQRHAQEEAYSKAFEACDTNFNHLKISHSQSSSQSTPGNTNSVAAQQEIDSKRAGTQRSSSNRRVDFFGSNDRVTQSTLLTSRYR